MKRINLHILADKTPKADKVRKFLAKSQTPPPPTPSGSESIHIPQSVDSVNIINIIQDLELSYT
tara:strand:- start:396 stop:587 length:192 start_codon:yes stop_codon:yes gene_type:complete